MDDYARNGEVVSNGGTAITPTSNVNSQLVLNNLLSYPPSSSGLQVNLSNSIGYLLQLMGSMKLAKAVTAP